MGGTHSSLPSVPEVEVPLYDLCVGKDICTIESYVRNCVDVNKMEGDLKETALQAAVRNSEYDFVKILLSHPDIDPNAESYYRNTPLLEACRLNNREIVRLLLSHPKVDMNYLSPLGSACDAGHVELVKELLELDGIDVNSENFKTPFYASVLRKRVEIVKLLLNDERVDVNHLHDGKESALHRVCGYHSDFEMLNILLSSDRIDVNVPSGPEHLGDSGHTPLHIAIRNNHLHIVERLLSEPEIDLNKTNSVDQTPFEQALRNYDNSFVCALLKHPKLTMDVERLSLFLRYSTDKELVVLLCGALEIPAEELYKYNETMLLTYVNKTTKKSAKAP
uniref:Uncharacterized protein n=1 Tax=Vannella robusta TaxID=1487602 RepID=A0A7S4INY1_9EUKA|mmetsp:Transcript_6019/g.7401  ORF Transcript_6019/g.7401 Transcript_6019/m.7401 type:complete len:335 (+) Transcript_6019:1-1005(+)